MIDIENYTRAIAWLRCALAETQQQPANETMKLGLLHTFELTHNISEAILREAYVSLDVDEDAPNLSLRELLRRSAEEGVRLSTPAQWLHYGLLLESTKQAWMEYATVQLETVLPVLPMYAEELNAFAESLKHRMAPLG